MSDHKDSNLPNKLAIHPPDDESAIPTPNDDDDDELQVLMWFKQIPPDNQEMLLVEFEERIMASADDQKEEKTDEEDGSSKIGRLKKMYKSLPPIHQKNFRSKIYREYQTAYDSLGEGNGILSKKRIESDVEVSGVIAKEKKNVSCVPCLHWMCARFKRAPSPARYAYAVDDDDYGKGNALVGFGGRSHNSCWDEDVSELGVDVAGDRLEWFKVKTLDIRGVSGGQGGGGNADGSGGSTRPQGS